MIETSLFVNEVISRLWNYERYLRRLDDTIGLFYGYSLFKPAVRGAKIRAACWAASLVSGAVLSKALLTEINLFLTFFAVRTALFCEEIYYGSIFMDKIGCAAAHSRWNR